MSMLSLTVHFIDKNFKQHNILHCKEFTGLHTAGTLADSFRDMFRSWGIPRENVHAVLRDDAKNMAKAMKDADLPSLYGAYAPARCGQGHIVTAKRL